MSVRLRIQPRSSRNEVVGYHGDAIRVRLTAPPIDGAANRALIRFLAKTLGLAPSMIRLDRGHAGRTKLVTLVGAELGQVVSGLGLTGDQLAGETRKR